MQPEWTRDDPEIVAIAKKIAKERGVSLEYALSCWDELRQLPQDQIDRWVRWYDDEPSPTN